MRGSVLKRGNGWTYIVYLGRDPITGKKRQKWVGGFPTKRACEQALTAALERIRTGEYAESGDLTTGAFLERWLTATQSSLRPTTYASYRDLLGGHVIPRIGSVRLADLSPFVITSLLGELLSSGRRRGGGGLSPRTVRYVHTVIAHALDDAVRWNLLARNPARAVDAPLRSSREMRAWSAVEVRAFLDHVRYDRLYAMWLLLCTTGMRRGEVVGLQWGDVDLDQGQLSVTRQLVEVGYEVHVAAPKTAKGRRLVVLDGVTVEALREHRVRQQNERAELGAHEPAALVFTRVDGGRLHPQYATKAFRKIARRAGLPPIRLHDLRHTAATHALECGVHPKVVAERLGHSSVQITLDLYSHVMPPIHREAAELVAARLFPANGGGHAAGEG